MGRIVLMILTNVILLKNLAWTPRPNENQIETDGRGVQATVFQRAVNHIQCPCLCRLDIDVNDHFHVETTYANMTDIGSVVARSDVARHFASFQIRSRSCYTKTLHCAM